MSIITFASKSDVAQHLSQIEYLTDDEHTDATAHMWASLNHPNDSFDTEDDADVERLRKIEVSALAFAQRE
jgi:hypothetical protein